MSKKEEGQLKIYEIVGIEKHLNKYVSGNIAINCIKKHDNIKLAKEDLDELEKSCIYVVNTHKNFDNITYWALGYVMGKGIAIIGYDDGKNIRNIPSDVEGLISISDGIDRFMTKINRALSELKPKEYPMDADWDKQQSLLKNEPEAHDGI